jgi:hypothetical protein
MAANDREEPSQGRDDEIARDCLTGTGELDKGTVGSEGTEFMNLRGTRGSGQHEPIVRGVLLPIGARMGGMSLHPGRRLAAFDLDARELADLFTPGGHMAFAGQTCLLCVV